MLLFDYFVWHFIKHIFTICQNLFLNKIRWKRTLDTHSFETLNNRCRGTRLGLLSIRIPLKIFNKNQIKKDTRVHTPLKSWIVDFEAHILVLPSIRLPQIFFLIKSNEKRSWVHTPSTPRIIGLRENILILPSVRHPTKTKLNQSNSFFRLSVMSKLFHKLKMLRPFWDDANNASFLPCARSKNIFRLNAMKT